MKEKYYKPLFYDNAYKGKKRGRKSTEERKIYIDSLRLKIVRKKIIIKFD